MALMEEDGTERSNARGFWRQGDVKNTVDYTRRRVRLERTASTSLRAPKSRPATYTQGTCCT